MDLLREIPKAINLTWDDEDWTQPIDYENMPFDVGNGMNMGI